MLASMVPKNKVVQILNRYISPVIVDTVLGSAVRRSGLSLDEVVSGNSLRFVDALKKSCGMFIKTAGERALCCKELEVLFSSMQGLGVRRKEPITIEVVKESDIVLARVSGRKICQELGFSSYGQLCVATVISELARNIFNYAGVGQVELLVLSSAPAGIQIIAQDQGPGIDNLQIILDGKYKSRTGLGKGILAVKKMMDEFDIETEPNKGTRIVVKKYLETLR